MLVFEWSFNTYFSSILTNKNQNRIEPPVLICHLKDELTAAKFFGSYEPVLNPAENTNFVFRSSFNNSFKISLVYLTYVSPVSEPL